MNRNIVYIFLIIFVLGNLINCFQQSEQGEESFEGQFDYNDYLVEEGVYVLNDNNFAKFVRHHKYALVEFYAPWCGHCKSLEPEYAQAAAQLKEIEEINIVLAKIDATENPQSNELYQIEGFPTLIWFDQGEAMTEYDGDRTSQEIVEWIVQLTSPPIQLINTQEEFEQIKSEKQHMIVLYTNSDEDENFQQYYEFAETYLIYNLYYIKDQELIKSQNIEQIPTIIMYRQFEEPQVKFEGNINEEELRQFADDHFQPSIIVLDPETFDLIHQVEGGSLIVLHGKEHKDNVFEQLKSVQNELKKNVRIFTADVAGEVGNNLSVYLRVSDPELPRVVIVEVQEDVYKYFHNGPFTGQEILKFAQKFNNRELEPYFFTQDIPKSQDKPVLYIVGKQFKEIVLDSDKSVFVKFYAPWCGHCRTLAPIWTELAEHYKDDDSIVIAEVDATQNEIQNVDIKGFPTMYLWPAGKKDKKPVIYYGERSIEEMTMFVKYHTDEEYRRQRDAELIKESQELEKQLQQGRRRNENYKGDQEYQQFNHENLENLMDSFQQDGEDVNEMPPLINIPDNLEDMTDEQVLAWIEEEKQKEGADIQELTMLQELLTSMFQQEEDDDNQELTLDDQKIHETQSNPDELNQETQESVDAVNIETQPQNDQQNQQTQSNGNNDAQGQQEILKNEL